MSEAVLTVGSIALDSVESPFGSVDHAVGGAGTFSAMAASLLAPVRLVGIIGDDFPDETLDTLESRGVDLEGVERVPGEKSFHWRGRYVEDMGAAETLETQLNVFADFDPKIPEAYRNTPYVFLANIQPSLQLSVLEQMNEPRFVMCDTMNLWIDTARDELVELLSGVDMVLVNDDEARQLTDEDSLACAARELLELGPTYAVIKQGEYGAALISCDTEFSLPCYPLETVCDPTGAGDSFAGGLIGYLASQGVENEQALRQGVACGTVCASACVERFSIQGLKALTPSRFCERYEQLEEMVRFDSLPPRCPPP